MKKEATLRNIAHWWKRAGNPTHPYTCIDKLLPDILNKDLVRSDQLIDFKASGYTHLLDGSYRSDGKGDFANVIKLQKLREAIGENSKIEYQEDGGFTYCRDNMLCKIRCLVSQTPLYQFKSLLGELTVLPFKRQSDEQEKIIKAIQTLFQAETEETCTYGMFLLILSSIFREMMICDKIKELYSEECVKRVLNEAYRNNAFKKAHEVLADEKYMNRTYRVYMYRSSMWDKEHLYDCGILKLDTVTTLEIQDTYRYSGSEKGDPITYLYKGTPIKANGIVYIFMNDENRESPGILTFSYCDFDNGEPMYFRLALFLSVDKGKPQVQRAVIAPESMELNGAAESAVRGVLRTSGRQIFLTDEELANFEARLSDKNWMENFKNVFEGQIKRSAFTQYLIDEKNILEYSSNSFSQEDLVEIACSLKDFSDSRFPGKGTHVDCDPPEHFHRLIQQ